MWRYSISFLSVFQVRCSSRDKFSCDGRDCREALFHCYCVNLGGNVFAMDASTG